MPTRAALRVERERGAAPSAIEANRRVLYDEAVTAAHSALDDAVTAAEAVAAAANLAEAQAAVTGLADTLTDAQSAIEVIRTDLA